MTLPLELETKRLKLRFLRTEDRNEVYRQFSDPDMCRYFSEPPCTWEEAEEIIQHYREPEGKGHLRYGMFSKEDGAFIGTCGYHYWDPELRQVEIGYDVWKDYWRQGYVSEALPELIRVCFEDLGADKVYILTHPENQASAASVGKLGFRECPPCRPTEEVQLCMALAKTEYR